MSVDHDARLPDEQVQITLKLRRSTIDALDQAVGEQRSESRAALVRRAIGQELHRIEQQREIELVAAVVMAHLEDGLYPDSAAMAEASADAFVATDPDEDWSELLARAQADPSTRAAQHGWVRPTAESVARARA